LDEKSVNEEVAGMKQEVDSEDEGYSVSAVRLV